MDKRPITILSSDWHIDKDNQQEIEQIVEQIISLAVEFHISRVYVLGDIFESRKAQPLTNLDFFSKILRKFEEAEVFLAVIPGNHDKVNYESEKSYLDAFQYHPYINLFSDYCIAHEEGVKFHLIPYFKEDTTYSKYLSKVIYQEGQKNILLTHLGVDGFSNNDRITLPSAVKRSDFSKFDSVFVGHYHNRSSIGNIHYIGSIQPRDFGEDNDKGFTIVFNDGSFEYVQAGFKEYKTIELDVDRVSKKELELLISKEENEEKNLRVILKGSESKLKSIDINSIQSKGVKVSRVNKELEEGILNSVKNEFISFTKESLLTEFDEYCKIKKIENQEYGKGKLLTTLKL